MPVLDSLPDPDTVKRWKGRIDYYVWRGLPIARSWPKTPRSHLTQGTLNQSARYANWLTRAHNTDGNMRDVAQFLTRSTNWTWRDFICFAIAGNLYNP